MSPRSHLPGRTFLLLAGLYRLWLGGIAKAVIQALLSKLTPRLAVLVALATSHQTLSNEFKTNIRINIEPCASYHHLWTNICFLWQFFMYSKVFTSDHSAVFHWGHGKSLHCWTEIFSSGLHLLSSPFSVDFLHIAFLWRVPPPQLLEH